MSESDLRNGLGAHLAAMPGVPPIDFENVGLDPSTELYLSQRIFPAEDVTVGIEEGGTDILAGIYQIMINVPKPPTDSGWGTYAAEIESIKAHFPRSGSIVSGSTRITFLKIFASGPLVDENYFRVPVSIRYRAI